MAWQRRAGTQSPQDKAAAGKHSRQMVCPAKASKNNSQQLAGLAAKQQPQTTLAGLSPCSAGRWRECGVLALSRWAQTYLPVSLPPIAFACHCPYPLP